MITCYSPTKQMRSAFGRFYGTMYSLLPVRIHYVMSLNTKYVVRSQQIRSAPLPHYGVLAVARVFIINEFFLRPDVQNPGESVNT